MPDVGARIEGALLLVAAVLLLAGHGFDDPAPRVFQPSARPAEMLRVVTWNVGGASGSFGAGLRDEHLDSIAETLRALDADLSFLQEVRDHEQLERLHDRLGEGWQALIAGRGERRVSVLARRGALRRIRLPHQCKAALGVEYISPGRPSVAAIAVHADAFSAKRRNEQIGAAADALNEMLQSFDLDVALLVGDLNLELDLGKRRDLFTDDEYRDVETYNYVATHLRDAGLGGASTAEPDRRLDYIFVASSTVAAPEAGPWKGRRVGDMDHDPVVADLEM